ncbi:MAG: 50S ribosomal protein L22 [Candidatus Woesearchaeota archaeon]|nr:MAG: 50S ribosomal protein L22 [Candidatus Woesearchaeota archaeon]
MVRISSSNVPVSRKASREICRFIKGKDVDKVIAYLELVKEGKKAIPYLRHRHDVAHRRGDMGPGRFPKRASHEIIKLLNSMKKSADDKGINSEALRIIHAAVSPGPVMMHYGRYRGIRRKMSSIELIAEETVKKEKKPKQKKKEKKKEAPKVETKPETKKEKPAEQPKETPKEEQKKKEEPKKDTKEVEKKK